MSSLISSNEVLARLKPFGILFEKSLADLIKGIRHHSKILPESLLEFLESAIQECRQELSTTDLETKAIAILKLTYLEMYGFDMSWCNFQILEIMSSSKFQQKRIGYLAAIQLFKNEQDLLILATNQFKKDLNSGNPFEVGLALSGIATIVTPNLAKDINDDVLLKLTHTKPYVRKKAVLAMYKIFLQYPDSLRINFQRVVQILDDPDISVVSAAINVICEISKKSPAVFMNYLPQFFTIMEDSKNNWLVIRVLKLFQSLLKVEPRMKKKILPTIIDLMVSTQASSLTYECINCIVVGSMLSPESNKDREIAKLCVEQLMKFFDTRDPNLKYVGLLALINIIELFPGLLQTTKSVALILMNCLTDNDMIIKTKALEISNHLVNEDNIAEVVKVLLLQLIPKDNDTVIPESYKVKIVLKILEISSRDNYSDVPNLRWYVAVLKDMINLTLLPLPDSQTTRFGLSTETTALISKSIGAEFKTLATKIPSIRSTILGKVIFEFVQDVNVLDNCPLILRDFYWIMGEYIDELKGSDEEKDENDDDDEIEDGNQSNGVLVYALGRKIQLFNTFVNSYVDTELQISSVNSLHFSISSKITNLTQHEVLAVFIQALVKVFSGIVRDYDHLYAHEQSINHDRFVELQFNLWKLIQYLKHWENNINYEVQERAASWLDFLNLCLEAMSGKTADIDRLKEDEIQHYRMGKHIVADVEASDEGSDEGSDEESESGESDESESDESESDEDESEGEDQTPKRNEYEDLDTENVPTQSLDDLTANPFSETDYLPPLLTHILSSFFTIYKLNPIAQNSQRNIDIPDFLDLDAEINQVLFVDLSEDEDSEDESLFIEPGSYLNDEQPLIQLDSVDEEQKRKERLERQKDDPFYITSAKLTKPKLKLARQSFIIENLQPGSGASSEIVSINSAVAKKPKKKVKKEKVVILPEEQILPTKPNTTHAYTLLSSLEKAPKTVPKKKNQLRIDSSNLDNFDLNAPSENVLDDEEEYEVDLVALRKKLQSEADTETKKKKKKSKKITNGKEAKKSSKSKSKSDSLKDVKDVNEVGAEADENVSPVAKSLELTSTSTEAEGAPDLAIAVKKLTTKKKKKKALIA